MRIDLYRLRYLTPDGDGGAGAATAEQGGGETDGDALAAQAYAELNGDAPEPKKKDPANQEAEPADKSPAELEAERLEKEGAKTPEQKSAREAEEAAAAGDKTPEQKAEAERLSQKKIEKDNLAKQEPLTDDKIQAFAEKRVIAFVQAKEEMEASQALLAKYNNDPIEVARALRNTQSEYDKLKGQKQEQVQAPVRLLTDAELKVDIEKFYTEPDAKGVTGKDKVLAKYRLDHPKRTDGMSDEAILEWATEDAMRNYKAGAPAIVEKSKREATDKRAKLLETVPKKDAKFLHDVKLILDATPDTVIMNPKYVVAGMLYYTKGQRYDADTAAEFQRGLKMGKEDPKILGQIGGDKGRGGSGAQGASQQGKGTVVLNDDQKQRAYDQFPDNTQEKAIESWIDVYKEDLKKNKNFLP